MALADSDPLTGLLNHRACSRTGWLSDSQRAGVLMLLDIDNFKLFNDTLGHLSGEPCSADRPTLRQICPADALCGRYGGDEFLVFAPMLDRKEARVLVRRCGRLCNSTASDSRRRFHPHPLSTGAAIAPDDGQQRPTCCGRPMMRCIAISVVRHALEDPSIAAVRGDSSFGVLEEPGAGPSIARISTLGSIPGRDPLGAAAGGSACPHRDERRALALAGPLHDVGKIAFPMPYWQAGKADRG